MRPYALKMFAPKDMVEVVTLAHRQLYRFRYHRAKMRLILEEFGNRYFGPLKEYLDNVSSETPHQYFQEGERISDVRSRFSTADMLVRRKQNYANRLAAFVLTGVRNRSRRHDELQRFFLANDSVTVATEVPVYIRREDIEHLENALHFDLVGEGGVRFRGGGNKKAVGQARGGSMRVATSARGREIPRLLTGHIDLVQVRNGCIHLLDYKPNAAKEKPIEQLTWYALALSRLTGLRLFNFVCGWFDERDYFEFYPLHAVKKLARPAKPVRFKSGAVVAVPRTDARAVADVRVPAPMLNVPVPTLPRALRRPVFSVGSTLGSTSARGRSARGRPILPSVTARASMDGMSSKKTSTTYAVVFTVAGEGGYTAMLPSPAPVFELSEGVRGIRAFSIGMFYVKL